MKTFHLLAQYLQWTRPRVGIQFKNKCSQLALRTETRTKYKRESEFLLTHWSEREAKGLRGTAALSTMPAWVEALKKILMGTNQIQDKSAASPHSTLAAGGSCLCRISMLSQYLHVLTNPEALGISLFKNFYNPNSSPSSSLQRLVFGAENSSPPSLVFPSHVDSCPQEFEQAPGDGKGQGSLVCYSPWDCRLGHNLATEQQVLSQELVTKPNIFLLIPQISKDFLIIINHP